MGYPRIEKSHRFVCVCLFSPLEHASSMAKYLNTFGITKEHKLTHIGSCTHFIHRYINLCIVLFLYPVSIKISDISINWVYDPNSCSPKQRLLVYIKETVWLEYSFWLATSCYLTLSGKGQFLISYTNVCFGIKFKFSTCQVMYGVHLRIH